VATQTRQIQFSSEVIHVFVGDAVFADEAEPVLTLRVVPLVVSVRPNVHTVLIAYNTTLGLQFIKIRQSTAGHFKGKQGGGAIAPTVK